MATLQSLYPIAKDVLLPAIPGRDLLRLCQTDKRIANLCRDDRLWLTKVEQEYPDYLQHKPDGLTWRAYYLLSISSHRCLVYTRREVSYLPSRLLSRQYIESKAEEKSLVYVFANGELLDLFEVPLPEDYNPDIVQEPDLKDADLVLIISEHDPDDFHLAPISRLSHVQGILCSRVKLERLLSILTSSGFRANWRGLIRETTIGRRDLCRLVYALHQLGYVDVVQA